MCTSVQVSTETRRKCQISFEQPCGCWDSDPGPLEEQPVTTKPSLQPMTKDLFKDTNERQIEERHIVR